MVSRNVDLEERLKELDAANARAAELERKLEESATQIEHLLVDLPALAPAARCVAGEPV